MKWRLTADGRAQAAGTAFFAVLLAVTVVLFLNVFAPAPFVAHTVFDRSYDRAGMQQAMRPAAVGAQLAEIAQCGSRAPGQPGHTACRKLLAERFERAGLEVLEQELDTVHPVCPAARLSSAGAALDVALWPLPPNHAQPMVTPPEGLQGELMLVTEASVRAARRCDDKIALVDLSQPLFKELGVSPGRFADLGFKALIVAHTGGLERISWSGLKSLRMAIPLNYVRLAADERIFQYVGRPVRLDVQTAYRNIPNRNLIGVLRAPGAQRRAVVLCAQYDGFTALPDLNHASVQALQIALQLRLLDGLLPHRNALRRDVIWVACGGDYMAQDSLNQLLSAIGRPGQSAAVKMRLEVDTARQAGRIRALTSILALFDNAGFGRVAAPSLTLLATLDPAARRLFDAEYRTVLRQRVFEAAEVRLQAQIAFERNPGDLAGADFRAFRAARQRLERLNTEAALPVTRFLERTADGFDPHAALEARFRQLIAYHETGLRRGQQELALNACFARYDEVLVVAPALNPTLQPAGTETISFTGGANITHAAAADAFQRLMQEAVDALGLSEAVKLDYRGARQGEAMAGLLAEMPVAAHLWSLQSHPAFAVINPLHDYSHFPMPLPVPAMTNLASIAGSMQVLGETVLAAAYGAGRFPPLRMVLSGATRGTVYAAGIGSAIVPNFALADTLLFARLEYATAVLGRYNDPVFFNNPYGQFERPLRIVGRGTQYSPQAAHFGRDGVIDYFSDSGIAAQHVYKSTEVRDDGAPVNLILYRGAPVAILNRVNPQSLRNFSDAVFLKPEGLVPFASTAKFITDDGILDFIDPAAHFFVALQAGSADNTQVASTRAFCLGTRDPAFKPDPANEIDGPGYLAQDTPVLRNPAAEAAASMVYLADQRMRRQAPYGMVDELTAVFQDKSRKLAAAADAGDSGLLERRQAIRQGLTYQILNHPVIRGSITEAIWGLLWYLGLLVPFVFFFEKLSLGFTDVRKQLLAQGVIFLAAFALLRMLHPAFQLIRSSVMILLGFVIILISGGITLVLAAKFRENLDALKKLQGGVRGVAVNKAGIMLTAFMLGLNNMHRRKVRTGLTCATLVLMTFVMICFTSVQHNIVDQESALAKAAYQGLLVKEPRFRAISAGEIAALDSRYGAKFSVNERLVWVGRRSWELAQLIAPELEVAFGVAPASTRQTAKSALLLRPTEPLRGRIRMLTTTGWFTAAQAAQMQGPYPVLLPDAMADRLGVTVDAVNRGGVQVRINGAAFNVQGIFQAASLETARDLDGDTLLPFDTEALVNPEISNNSILAERDAPRVAAAHLLIALVDQFPVKAEGELRPVSVAVDMGAAGFADARQEATAFLEQTGRESFYGLDGVAYLGRRTRARALTGMVDLLIPLILAALTVLNTMKGSVYERRDEIYVYNAVGIAPRYVFGMFIAEALVYAVVGAFLGYLLSQGVGRALTVLGWTGGLNMNFTSLSTVYASLAIAAATLLSTWFPARSAMKIAQPAEQAGWKLPHTEFDELAFDLPFTFTHFDRMAVLAFFHQYFVNHGEGSAGPFFAAQPDIRLSARRDPLAHDAYIPTIEVPVWLKPFDLGVSQRLIVELATDPGTGEYISRMRLVRLTGTREAWLRLNAPLVARIRRHFLHWRTVSAAAKQAFHIQARQLLEAHVAGEEHRHGQS